MVECDQLGLCGEEAHSVVGLLPIIPLKVSQYTEAVLKT